MKIETPLKLGQGANAREHHMARARRVKKERNAVGWLLRQFDKPATPCTVTITRIAPGQGLDPADNLPHACKAVVDAFAEWIGINDRSDELVRYQFRNERGEWGLRIEVTS